MRFTFTGTLGLNGLKSKNPYVKEGKSANGKKWERFGCSIASAKNNRADLELFGGEQDKINTSDLDGNKIEILWADRHDEDVVKSVASYRKHVAKIDDDRFEFISSYDFVEYLKEHADEIKDKKFTITGQTNANVYKGKVSQRFQIQNIYAATDDAKTQLKVSTEYFFNKNCIDTADWVSEKIINVNGYIETYIAEEKKKMYVPLSIVFDCSKIDFENEKHIKIVKSRLSLIGCDLVDGKIKCKLKGDDFYVMAVVLGYVNGSEKVEFTEDMLTPKQKEQYELGLKTLDDFRPAGSVYGEQKTLYKLLDFDLNKIGANDYSDGYIEVGRKEEEFLEDVYVPSKEETVEEVIEKKSEPETVAEDDDDEDLFN